MNIIRVALSAVGLGGVSPYLAIAVPLVLAALFGYHKLAISSAYDDGHDAGIQQERKAWEIERDNLIAANKIKSSKVAQAQTKAATERRVLSEQLSQKFDRQNADRETALQQEWQAALDAEKQRADVLAGELASNRLQDPPTQTGTCDEKPVKIIRRCDSLRDYRPSRRLLQSID